MKKVPKNHTHQQKNTRDSNNRRKHTFIQAIKHAAISNEIPQKSYEIVN